MDYDQAKEFEEFDKLFKENVNRPQELCDTCGRCCKSITTFNTYEELKQMAKEDKEEAWVFVDFFKRYPSIEEARKVVPEQVDQVIKELSYNKDFDLNTLSFYYCPHVTDDGLCSVYETRPYCCRVAPRHGWSLMPPGCGFEGWQFEEREKIKASIRYLKEYLQRIELVYNEDEIVPGRDMTVKELRDMLTKKIEPWERYGSLFW